MADNTVNKDSTKKKTSQHCCVPLCTSDSRYNPSLHFHHIPSKHKDVKKQWIINIRRDEGPQFKITSSTVVCLKHFVQSDYKTWTPVRKNLKPGAVPTIFDWTTKKEPRRALKRKLLSPRDADVEIETRKEDDQDEEFEFEATLLEEPSTSQCDSNEQQRISELEKNATTEG